MKMRVDRSGLHVDLTPEDWQEIKDNPTKDYMAMWTAAFTIQLPRFIETGELQLLDIDRVRAAGLKVFEDAKCTREKKT